MLCAADEALLSGPDTRGVLGGGGGDQVGAQHSAGLNAEEASRCSGSCTLLVLRRDARHRAPPEVLNLMAICAFYICPRGEKLLAHPFLHPFPSHHLFT